MHTPDLYDGNTFDDLEDGVGYAREVGFAKGALVFSAALPASEFGEYVARGGRVADPHDGRRRVGG